MASDSRARINNEVTKQVHLWIRPQYARFVLTVIVMCGIQKGDLDIRTPRTHRAVYWSRLRDGVWAVRGRWLRSYPKVDSSHATIITPSHDGNGADTMTMR